MCVHVCLEDFSYKALQSWENLTTALLGLEPYICGGTLLLRLLLLYSKYNLHILISTWMIFFFLAHVI